jgi:hypothetical protein
MENTGCALYIRCALSTGKYGKLGNQTNNNEKDGACGTYEERRDARMVLVGKPVLKRPPGRSRHRWEDNNKMSLQEIGWQMEGMD